MVESVRNIANTEVRPEWIIGSLTARVLEGVAAGRQTQQLCDELFLSRQGIEYHVAVLFRQFGVNKRAALVAKAYNIGVLEPGDWPPKVPPQFIGVARNSDGPKRQQDDAASA